MFANLYSQSPIVHFNNLQPISYFNLIINAIYSSMIFLKPIAVLAITHKLGLLIICTFHIFCTYCHKLYTTILDTLFHQRNNVKNHLSSTFRYFLLTPEQVQPSAGHLPPDRRKLPQPYQLTSGRIFRNCNQCW